MGKIKLEDPFRDRAYSLLEEYTRFLLDNGYTDSDVYDELPTAIDRFLNPSLDA